MQRTQHNDTHATVLACDPSFTAWGWAILRNHTVIDSGCIKTSPEAKKRKIRQGDDRVRRTSEIVQTLMKIVEKYKVDFIVSELPHYSQNAKSAIMIGVVMGILQTMSDVGHIPIEWYSENDAKKALLGRNSASKAQVIAAVNQAFETTLTGPKYVQEAVADSLAIYNVATLQSQTLKILLR